MFHLLFLVFQNCDTILVEYVGVFAMLKDVIEELNVNNDHLGLSVEHLSTGESYDINGDELFQTASTIKVPILWSLFRNIDEGKLALNDKVVIREEDFVPGSGVLNEFVPGLEVSIQDLATLMIIISDNTATDILLERLGKETVEADMRKIGLNETYVRQTIWDLLALSVGMDPNDRTKATYNELTRRLNYFEVDDNSIVFKQEIENNVMTPNDMTKLLKLIDKKETLSLPAHEAMLEIMRRQHYTQRIGRYLPYGAKLASKTGSLFSVYNDVGIVEISATNKYIISAFVKDMDEEKATELIAQISKRISEYVK